MNTELGREGLFLEFFGMRSGIPRAIRCAIPACLAGVVILIGTRLSHVNHTTVALALVLLILAVSIRWGRAEALVTSLAGGLGFVYYLLPPRGFVFGSADHMVTLLAFLCTAITTGCLASRANHHRNFAEERTAQLERLRRLDDALLGGGMADTVLERIPEQIVTIFRASGAVYFDSLTDRLFRSGPNADRISEGRLRKVAFGEVSFDSESSTVVVGVRDSGSLGIAGWKLPGRALDAVAERVAVAVAKARAARESMDAELLQRSENLKSAVLDALAHEIKGPFATIKVCVSTLRSDHPGNAMQQRELLEIMDEELERIERWIDDAVRVSGREATELRLNKAPNLIGEVIARALEGLGPQLDGRRIEMRVGDALPAATFDAEMIEKVIRQLVDNAIKYSSPGSPIRIGADFTGAELVIRVADSGCGIPKADQQRIFEKYYRGRARGFDAPGTGLGLASAKCIIDAHGGEIWVDSIPDTGSVFYISLPVMTEARSEQSESPERG